METSSLFERALPLLGEAGVARLTSARVLVVGLGGVGGACAEALCRAGVGHLSFLDGDVFSSSNLNRQILATHKTLGKNKAQVAAERAMEINPGVIAQAYPVFYRKEEPFAIGAYDYVVDAIDDTEAKTALIEAAVREKIPIVSAMGAAGKLDPSRFRVADLSETSGCALAKKMRKLLRERGITSLPVVFSPESARVVTSPPASVSFVPPVAGYLLAAKVVCDLCGLSMKG